MRSLRQQTTRDILKKKSYSSLSSLPSSNRRIKRSMQYQTKKDKISSNTKSIQKTHEQKEKEYVEEEYDSTDSLDQLLDNNFIPSKSKPNHMKIAKNVTPRKQKNIGSRAKAMALMASTGKRSTNNMNNKYITPLPRKRRSRKIITPTPTSSVLIIPDVTPKEKGENALKLLNTPCTPTPVKLIRNLNVKTPKTCNVKYASWKDIEFNANNQRNQYNKNKVCKPQRLPLPFKLNVLLQKFNALESTLALFMRKNSFFVHYENISKSVQQICRKRFSEKDLQEILTIIPEFYHIQWTANIDKMTKKKDLRLTLAAIDYDGDDDDDDDKNDKNKNDKKDKNDKNENDKKGGKYKKEKLREIGIKFLKVSKLKEREKMFRLRLIEYVLFHHKEFLNDNVLIEFDPFQTGKWHKKFDLENVKDIKISPLPSKPRKDTDEIEKMIKEQELKLQDIVQKEIEKAAKVDDIPDHLKHLSPTFIAKIRAKKANKIKLNKLNTFKKTKKKKKENKIDSEQYRLEQLPYLVTLIKGIYVSLKKSSLSCNDLINLIKKRHRNHHILNAEIWKQLQLLNELKSKFFKIKQGPMVKAAKINKKIATKEVLDEINQRIKKK